MEEKRRSYSITTRRPSVLEGIAVFVLSFALLLCILLSLRLLACKGTELTLDVRDGQMVLVLLALALSITSQNPQSFITGVTSGALTSLVTVGSVAGLGGLDLLRGSILFFALAPVLTGLVVGVAQHDKALDRCSARH
jgi:hypothetical protein